MGTFSGAPAGAGRLVRWFDPSRPWCLVCVACLLVGDWRVATRALVLGIRLVMLANAYALSVSF
jgi:hypothetical protein